MEGGRKRGTGDGANGASAGGKRARGESGVARPRSGPKPYSSRDVRLGDWLTFVPRGSLGFELFAMPRISGNRGKLPGVLIWWDLGLLFGVYSN